MRPDYRLYIDEVGSATMKRLHDTNERFLSLTGVIMNLDYVRREFHPHLEGIKARYFDSHPDEPVILHRKEIVSARRPFRALRDAEVRRRFDADIKNLFEATQYSVCTVTIDKFAHHEKYGNFAEHPYHFAVEVLLERYCRWLKRNQSIGDVMAESRGRVDNLALSDAFTAIYERGTDYVRGSHIRQAVTSKSIKIKDKQANIAGLQLADLIAHPSFRHCYSLQTGVEQSDTFGRRIACILQRSKYMRTPDGTIDGVGRKWLP